MASTPRKKRAIQFAAMAAALLVILCLFLWPIFPSEGREHFRTPRQVETREDASRPAGQTEIRDTTKDMPLIQGDQDRLEVPVHWMGQQGEGLIAIRLIAKRGGGVAVEEGQLGAAVVSCPRPADGLYRFDFASAGIYSVDHEIRVMNGDATLVSRPWYVEGKLPVARAVRVELVAEITKGKPATNRVASLRWWASAWPTRLAPQHDLQVVLGEPSAVLVPVDGVNFRIDSESYFVKLPKSPEFTGYREGDTLRIELGRLIPLIVDIVERSQGQWTDLLGDGGDRTVILQAAATSSDGTPMRAFARNKAFTRSRATVAATGRGVDRFTMLVPAPTGDLTVDVMVRVHGGSVVATGRATGGSNSEEINVLAEMLGRCSLRVRVVDENGEPIPGIVAVINVFSLASNVGAKVMRSAAPQQRQTTNAAGEVRFTSLPVGESLHAQVIIKSDFPVVSPTTEVALAEEEEYALDVTLRTSDRRSLHVVVVNGDDPPATTCSIAMLEGDGLGAWHRMHLSESSSSATIYPKSDYVFVVARCGKHVCATSKLLQADAIEIRFDLTDTASITGTLAIPGKEEVTVYPYSLDAPVAWAATLGIPSLPSITVDEHRSFSVRVPNGEANLEWRAVAASGDVYSLTAMRPSGNSTEAEFRIEKLTRSTTSFSMDIDKLKDTTDVALLICPVYHDDRRALEMEMRFGVRTDVDGSGTASVSLPHGRYVAMLTYRDGSGASRLGYTSGQHAEFESRRGFETKVHLPIR